MRVSIFASAISLGLFLLVEGKSNHRQLLEARRSRCRAPTTTTSSTENDAVSTVVAQAQALAIVRRPSSKTRTKTLAVATTTTNPIVAPVETSKTKSKSTHSTASESSDLSSSGLLQIGGVNSAGVVIGSNGQVMGGEGDMTWYGTGLGACGITNSDSDMICAVSHILYDSYGGGAPSNPNLASICNKKIRMTVPGATTTIEVTVTDRCVACKEGDLDLAPSAFAQLAPTSVGRVPGMTWEFI